MSSQQRQAIHSIHNKKFWTEFFYLYESLPALWDVNNPLYKNRQVKGDAYDTMVDKLREIEPTADREDVLRKINIFRTNYRRECSRISLSLQEGRHYRSTLWYFELLNFLQTADTRRERKRKLLDDGIEKSIMRKRRNITTITKHTDTFLVATKKGDIIEYQPHSSAHAADIAYDNYEEPDFDYVVEDLSHTLVETKRDSTEIHSALQMQGEGYHDLEDDDDHSQTEYDQDFQTYSIQRNDAGSSANSQNSKHALTTDNLCITSTIGSNIPVDDDGSLIMPDGPDQHYREYHNEAASPDANAVLHDNGTLAASQWCLKTTHIPKNLSIQGSKQTMQMSAGVNLSTHDAAPSTTSLAQDNSLKMTTKFVRDVKTMTLSKSNIIGQAGKLSESSEIIAKSWAIQYEELAQEQKVLARKAINDILFEGYMGHLAIGLSGRVTNSNSVNYKNQKLSKCPIHDEVESGEVYQQAATTSSTSLPSHVEVDTKTPDEWLGL